MDRTFFRILLGSLAIIFFASLTISILNLLYTSHLVRTHSVDEFKEIFENPPLVSKIIGWVSTLVQFFVYFLAGWFAGIKMKKKRWILRWFGWCYLGFARLYCFANLFLNHYTYSEYISFFTSRSIGKD